MTTSPGLAETFAGELALHGVRLPVKSDGDNIADANGDMIVVVHLPHGDNASTCPACQTARLIAKAINAAGGCGS